VPTKTRETDAKIDWSYSQDDFEAWCTGKLVRLWSMLPCCLNATGFMHNRLRMVTAMFLTKDLIGVGRALFFKEAADRWRFASNNGGWQWSALNGYLILAPYFRIMNPFSQA
jgi:deoxyribodipyrimidine photo-lyase